MINNLKTLNKRVAALEGRVAELEACQARPDTITTLQFDQKKFANKLSNAMIAAMNEATRDKREGC